MAFPTGTSIPIDNVNSGASDPSLARTDIYNLIVAVNNIIASADTASGVALLNASNKYDGTKMPATITGTTTIAPSSGVVNIQDILRLTALRSTDLSTRTGNALGDIAISDDAAGGNPALCVYTGTAWRYLAMSSFTAL
jgi:hypothetical protein